MNGKASPASVFSLTAAVFGGGVGSSLSGNTLALLTARSDAVRIRRDR